MKIWAKRVFLLCILASAVSILYAAVGTVNAAGTGLNITKLRLSAGETKQLKVKGEKAKIKWKSSDKKTVTVTAKGMVKAVKKGNARITASAGKKKYICRVTVTDSADENKQQKQEQGMEKEYFDISYDTQSDSQKLDLYLPETGPGPFPLVVFIHGGGWFSGDKADGQERAWVTLRSNGYAVASLNYRLSGEAAHPAGLDDCRTAVRWLKEHADEYRIDARHIAVSGDSSGGHYALMEALQDSGISCAVVWYPATDLSETMRTVQNGEYTGFGADFAWSNIESYVGKKIQDTDDPCLADASPVNYISKDMPPVLLQHGDADTICPVSQSRRFYQKALDAAGEDKVFLDIIKGAEHGDSAFETKENMERIQKFLDQYIGSEKKDPIQKGDAAHTNISGSASGLEQVTVNGKTVYTYIPQSVKMNPDKKVPMVLFMCGTSCDPVDNLVQSGWVAQAESEGFIVISPDYNNYATYSETGFLIAAVEYMEKNYPVDTNRVYSTGFSNGGAASVALTRDYPQYFAAISAMGWMVDLDNKGHVFEKYDMPFQVVQGDGEFTERTDSGAMAVMDDEKEAVRSLFLYNEMIDSRQKADYDRTPYWGWQPDDMQTQKINGRNWKFSNYYKDGFRIPFAQLVLVEDKKHTPRMEEAEIAWNFFKNFWRDNDGKIKTDDK